MACGDQAATARPQQAGQILNVDLDAAAELLYGPVYYRWLLHTGPISRPYVDAVIAMMLRAITDR